MRCFLFALTLTLGAGAAAAGGPVDLLFSTPHMRDVPAGGALRYDHVRVSDPSFGIGPDFDQAISLAMGATGPASFTLDAEGAPRTYDVNPGVPGNPLLMVFLETTLRNVAKATGGSEFYLRNRLKDGLRDGLTAGPDGALAMRPFEGDAHGAQLGPFVDMRVTFEVSEAAPGMLVALRAEAGPAEAPIYREEIRYAPAP